MSAAGPFRDRRAAGRALGIALAERLHDKPRPVVVLGLPRGGVPVAAEVAGTVGGTLDVLVVRKLGVVGHEELAFGAVASGGYRVLNDEVVRGARVSEAEVAQVTTTEEAEVRRREA